MRHLFSQTDKHLFQATARASDGYHNMFKRAAMRFSCVSTCPPLFSSLAECRKVMKISSRWDARTETGPGLNPLRNQIFFFFLPARIPIFPVVFSIASGLHPLLPRLSSASLCWISFALEHLVFLILRSLFFTPLVFKGMAFWAPYIICIKRVNQFMN